MNISHPLNGGSNDVTNALGRPPVPCSFPAVKAEKNIPPWPSISKLKDWGFFTGTRITILSQFRSTGQVALRKKNERLVFATNAGMFGKDFFPLGLHVEHGNVLQTLRISQTPAMTRRNNTDLGCGRR